MSRSLRLQLSKTLVLAVLACGAVASLAAFYFAYSEAQEFQDDTLRQIAALSVGARSQMRQLDAAGKAVEDPESRVRIVRLPIDPRPRWLPANVGAGFHTVALPSGQGDMRIFVRDTGNGRWLVVAQSTESRNEIAFNSALRTLIPLLVLLPILVGLIAIIARRELTPLTRLSDDLDHQSAAQPSALPEAGVPDEIIPFVQAINRLLERVEKLIAGQRRFVADAAHELRTPLTALSLQAQNLAQADTPERMRERLVPLQAGIERARRLTVQLLDLARLQAGGHASTEIDVPALARELAAEFQPLAEAKEIDLGIEEAGLKSMRSDPQALGLIMRNALDNALKYTPRGGKVTLRLRRLGNGASVEVIDNGPGIPVEELERVFNPFHRLPNATAEGSGLGLAIVREAAARAGGTVSLENRKPGLVFCFTQTDNARNR